MKYAAISSTPGRSLNFSRRRFLQTVSASVAFSALGAAGLDIVNGKPKRV